MEEGWPHSRPVLEEGEWRMKRKLFIGAVIFGILVFAVGGWTVRGVRWAAAG
jgi:hypothetical protein